MKLEELEKIKKKIAEEFNIRNDNINKLDQKQSIISRNDVYNRIARGSIIFIIS